MIHLQRLSRLRGAAMLVVLLLGVCALASSASAETVVNRWTQAPIGVQGGTPVAQPGVPGANWIFEDAGGGFVRLKDAGTGQYLHVENGPLGLGPIQPGWWSAQWTLEQTGDGFVRIKNRWTGVYLNIEKGPLVATAIQPGWWSAQWQVAGGGAPAARASVPEQGTAPQPQLQPVAASPEQACIDLLMNPKKGAAVAWGPDPSQVQWGLDNAKALCAGTPKADLPIGCFKGAIALGATWQQAIPWCKYQFSACAYATFDQNGNNWEQAVNQCHFGGRGTKPNVALLKAGTACTLAAVDPNGADLTQDEAAQLCGERDAVRLPVDCFRGVVSPELDKSNAIALCRNTLSPGATGSCLQSGRAAGTPIPQVVEVCRMQDDQLHGVTQQAHTYGLGMRDSCVKRRLGMETGKMDFAGAWNACKGQVLF